MRLLRAGLAAIGLAVLSLGAIAQSSDDEGWPAGERVLGKYRAGHYAEVIAEGPAALDSEPWNAQLRLALANSLLWAGREWPAIEHYQQLLDNDYGVEARLNMANALAWSGRMLEAIPHYKMLLAGPKAGEAKLGLANAYRWMDRPDLALPLYRELRAEHPMEDVGEEGLVYALRSVRPRTTVGFGYSHDNTPYTRREALASHTFRTNDNTLIWGVDANGGREHDEVRELTRREYGFRFEAVDWFLAPRVAVSRETEPQERWFGDARLQVAPWPLYVNAGRINWGRLAFTANALERGLTANRYGAEGRYQLGAGELRGFANYFDVSDGNTVVNADVRLTSRWRPWGREIKPFIGMHVRFSDRTDPDYWSPRRYGLGYVGLEGEWERRDWTVNLIGQVGVKLFGEASAAWGAALVAKRWLADDWAVGVNAYAQTGTRTSAYRAYGATFLIEKLW